MKFLSVKFIIIIILILLILLIAVYLSKKNFLENFTNEQVDIVISRYMEDLKWLDNDNFRNYRIIIYNKGSNDDFYKPPNSVIIKLPNYGRESHTYLFHIINNYENLSDLTVFLPGSSDYVNKYNKIEDKYNKTMNLIKTIKNIKSSCYICTKQSEEEIEKIYNFTIDNYNSTNESNKKASITKIDKSDIRPYGKWYEKHIGNDRYKECITYKSIFSVTKEDITQFPLSYYENLFNEVDKKENPETGHYFERSWFGIFNPKDPVLLFD